MSKMKFLNDLIRLSEAKEDGSVLPESVMSELRKNRGQFSVS